MALTAATVIAGGCAAPVTPIYKVEMRRSPEHHLVVANDTRGPLSVLPAPDGEGAPLALPPGATATIAFRVVTLADLERSDHGRFRLREGATSRVVVSDEPTRYIGMAGVDGVVQVEFPDGMRWKFLIELGDCWFEDPPAPEGHLLSITGPPDSGIPAVPCP